MGADIDCRFAPVAVDRRRCACCFSLQPPSSDLPGTQIPANHPVRPYVDIHRLFKRGELASASVSASNVLLSATGGLLRSLALLGSNLLKQFCLGQWRNRRPGVARLLRSAVYYLLGCGSLGDMPNAIDRHKLATRETHGRYERLADTA